jgi:hypothetical protein
MLDSVRQTHRQPYQYIYLKLHLLILQSQAIIIEDLSTLIGKPRSEVGERPGVQAETQRFRVRPAQQPSFFVKSNPAIYLKPYRYQSFESVL